MVRPGAQKLHHDVQNEFGPITVHNMSRSIVLLWGQKVKGEVIQFISRRDAIFKRPPVRSRICVRTLYPSRKIEREVESRFINVCGLEEGEASTRDSSLTLLLHFYTVGTRPAPAYLKTFMSVPKQ